MKRVVSILFISAVLASFAISANPSGDYVINHRHSAIGFSDSNQEKNVQEKTVYTCPMHSEIVQDKAGKCPKCGMSLVVKEAKKNAFTCPMHPEVVQDKAGKCPKCGMNLVSKEANKDSYSCPMHPEIVQDKAGKCPKCGMDLEKKVPAKK